MDINKRLNEIIFKYNLDSVYPQYRKRIGAEQFIRGWMREMAGNSAKLKALIEKGLQ